MDTTSSDSSTYSEEDSLGEIRIPDDYEHEEEENSMQPYMYEPFLEVSSTEEPSQAQQELGEQRLGQDRVNNTNWYDINNLIILPL